MTNGKNDASLTDAEIEAGLTDTLPDEVAAELCEAHDIDFVDLSPSEDQRANIDIRMVSRDIVMRLRAGGISEETIRQILVFDPKRTRDYFRKHASLLRQLRDCGDDLEERRQIHMELAALRIRQHGKYGALAGRK